MQRLHPACKLFANAQLKLEHPVALQDYAEQVSVTGAHPIPFIPTQHVNVSISKNIHSSVLVSNLTATIINIRIRPLNKTLNMRKRKKKHV